MRIFAVVTGRDDRSGYPDHRPGRGNLVRGDNTVQETSPTLHSHAVVGFRDGSKLGGHVQGLEMQLTLQVTVIESPKHVAKRVDAEIGSALAWMESR